MEKPCCFNGKQHGKLHLPNINLLYLLYGNTHRSRTQLLMKNCLLTITGAVSLALGVAGMFLPVLPTTPFLLLTAWCWIKGSPRMHAWLMSHPKLGPYIKDFQEHKCISRRVKAVSTVTLWLTITLSIILVNAIWIRILLVIIAIGVTVHILSFKTKK